MKMTRSIIFKIIYSAVLFIGIFLFLWLGCPQYLLYQEQNQLFLFTWRYFAHAVAVPGGLADYLSEFVVQFYYVPLYGALLASFVLTLTQVFLGLACRRCVMPDAAYALAALPSVIYLGAMGDENILFSYAVAMAMTALLLSSVTIRKTSGLLSDTLLLIFGYAVLSWLAGPFAMVFVVAGGILMRRPVAIAVAVPVALAMVWGVHTIWYQQYPLSSLMLGINYCRVPEMHPASLAGIAAVMALIPSITLLKTGMSRLSTYAVPVAVAVFALVYVPASYNKDKSRALAYESLVRQGRWTDIIEKAERDRPSDTFSLQALNLALGMTGQLTESMFRFDQKGIEGLIGSYRLDNTSQLITAEALYRLGLTNIAFSTTFDLQEAIMNDRKSGRHMKRLAECMLINGKYDVAAKYIGFLRNSLFYRDWALQAEKLLDNDSAVEAHPVYGPLRRNAFTKDGFYYHSLLDKILAMLVLDGNGNNRLAWDYFCATSMLKGDLATLAGVCNFYTERFGQQPLPRHVQEALAMYWTFSHPSFEGLPFPIGNEVKRETETLAKAVMTNKNNPGAWQNAAPGSYGVYFLNHSNSTKPAPAPDYQPTHE